MKNLFVSTIAILALGLLTGPALSQTVTAGSTGDFTTLAAAITSFRAGGSNEANPDPNVINLLDASYDEALPNVDVQLTINAAGGGSTILLQQQTDPAGTDGWDLVPAGGDVVIVNDLVIIPSETSTPTDDLLELGSTTGAKVILDNCLISSNWSGGPASADGLTISATPVSTAATAQIGDNGVNITGAETHIGLNECIITALGGTGTTPDNILATGGSIVNVTSCVISHAERMGIQFNNALTTLTITGTRDKPTIFYKNGYVDDLSSAEAGIFCFNGNTLTIDNTIFAYNNDNGIGSDDAPGWTACDISYTVFAFNGQGTSDTLDTEAGFEVGDGGTAAVNMDHCTFIGNGGAGIYATTLASLMSVTDSIIAGNVGSGTGIAFASAGGGTITLNYCAVVESGPDALAGKYQGPGTVTENNVISDDPQFISSTLFSGSAVNPDFLDIGNFTYGPAGSGGSPLTGYGDYAAGPTPTPTITPVIAGTGTNWKDYR